MSLNCRSNRRPGSRLRPLYALLPKFSGAVGTEAGQHSQRGQTQKPLHFVGSLERLIQVLLEEGRADAQPQSQHHTQDQVQKHLGLGRIFRRLGRVYHSNVAGS